MKPLSSLRILVIPDKFKGSLSASEAASAICLGFERVLPEARLHRVPLADGGEGTAELFVKLLGGQMVECETTDPLGRRITARYGWMPSQRQAVIEMSAASGLQLVSESERDPLRTTTFGTGTLMIDAARRGARKIFVGIGGSATNDAGVGMAAALGHRFVDERGTPLAPVPASFPRIARIERATRIFTPTVVAISDVRNLLLGPKGCSHTYGPQKGASPENVLELESCLTHLADLVRRDFKCDYRDTPGSGAAGGLGFGLLSFCQAQIQSGFDTFADMMELDRIIARADIVITGEGALDPQTLDGKGPGGVAIRAKKAGKPVIAFAGTIQGENILDEHFDVCFPLASGPLTMQDSMRDARLLLVRAAERAAKLIAITYKSL